MELKPYRVKPGAVLAHEGKELAGGTDVQLQPHIAHEVRHLVDPVDEAGVVKTWGTAAEEKLAAELAAAKPHERVSILAAAIADKRGDLERLEKAHAAEVKLNETAAKALEKKPAATSKADAQK